MSIWEILAIGVGLSMDAFAISICKGLALGKPTAGQAALTGLYFGGFQALMPVAGYLLGTQFADTIATYSHWVAFAILTVIGAKMLWDSRDQSCSMESGSLSPRVMLPLAVATSIDALAVGVSFAFLHTDPFTSAGLIGVTTFVISAAGIWAGGLAGDRFRSKATIAGGVILVLLGLKILLQGLFASS